MYASRLPERRNCAKPYCEERKTTTSLEFFDACTESLPLGVAGQS